MIGFEGRLQWRQRNPFKLRANLPQRKNPRNYKWLGEEGQFGRTEIRIQNLRFAQELCDAQKLGRGLDLTGAGGA
jgi:hypothetical protein